VNKNDRTNIIANKDIRAYQLILKYIINCSGFVQ